MLVHRRILAHRSLLRVRRAPLALAAAVLLFCAAANAEPTAADRETARTLMENARDRRAQNDLKGALVLFQQADEIMRVPTTGLEVARMQATLGLLVEARDTITHVMNLPMGKHEPQPFLDARARAEALDDELARRIGGLKISVRAPPGVEPTATVDDVAVPVLGVLRKTNPGHHVIVVASEGTKPQRQEIDLHEAESRELTFVVTGAPRATGAPKPGVPAITPASAEQPVRHRSHALEYTGFAAAGLGVAVGTVTGIISLSKKSSLESGCPDHNCSPSLQSDHAAASTMATVSTISFAVAAAGAGAAVIGLLMNGSSPPPAPVAAQVKWRVLVGAGSVGVWSEF